MAEFTYAEALKFQKDNLTKQEERLKQITDDLDWLMKQRVVGEVNTSRLYNKTTQRRKAERERAKGNNETKKDEATQAASAK